MTVYLDVVFFENVILNYIIILSTAIISKSKIKLTNIILSSIIGGIFSIINYIISFNLLINIVLKIATSLFMIIIAFRNFQIKRILKQLIFFYFVSFTFGGIAFMLIFIVKPQNIIIEKNHFIGTYPIKMAVLAGGLGFIIITILSKIIKNKITQKLMILDLEIFYDGKSQKVKTMIDTGNLLKEPITKADVIIVEKQSLESLISTDVLENISIILKGKWIESENIYSYKFSLIPFSSLGNENGLLIGFRPDYIKIYYEDEFVRSDIVVGIYDGKLSRNNLYTSLIGINILNGEEKKDEYIQKV